MLLKDLALALFVQLVPMLCSTDNQHVQPAVPESSGLALAMSLNLMPVQLARPENFLHPKGEPPARIATRVLMPKRAHLVVLIVQLGSSMHQRAVRVLAALSENTSPMLALSRVATAKLACFRSKSKCLLASIV
jgi:hypothetical protein